MRAQIIAGTAMTMLIAIAFCLSLAGIWSGLGASVIMHLNDTAQMYHINSNSLGLLAGQMGVR